MKSTKFRPTRYLRYIALTTLVTIGLISSPTWSWSTDPSVNTLISNAARSQTELKIIDDGAQGAIMVWKDNRNYRGDIYAQRVNTNGEVQWNWNGVLIAATGSNKLSVTTDGAGGAIISWHETRDLVHWDIYAQRVNANGVVQWTTGGVAISTAADSQFNSQIVSDGAGGAIICWLDARSGTDNDIYVQRVNADGVTQWTANGVALTTGMGEQDLPKIVSDGAGGAIIGWRDQRVGIYYNIYAQRVNAEGAVQWPPNGISISTTDNNKDYHQMTPDGAGGAILSWGDYRVADWDIFAQRVNASGAVQWTANGVAISIATNNQILSQIVTDGAEGAIISWEDGRSRTENVYVDDIYAQRINASGTVQWTENGVFITNTDSGQSNSRTTADNAGGAIIAWRDERNDGSSEDDIYAQRIDSNGAIQWGLNSAAISIATGNQSQPTLTTDDDGNSIIAWIDQRNYASSSLDIYAQQVSDSGEPGAKDEALDDETCLPVPTKNGKITFLCL